MDPMGVEEVRISLENERMSPENQWSVQMYFLLKGCPFSGDMLVFGGVLLGLFYMFLITIH